MNLPDTHQAAIELPSARPTRRPIPKALAERYEDIRFIGEGGMGTVYRALDPRLGRPVALKLLKGTEADQCDRFLGEARSQARIGHEHVCRVYEAGEIDGEPYISMQFIDGQSLSRMRNQLSIEQCVYILKEVSIAVHEAHRIGIIHRDLKPGNILVETRADGSHKPWVMDFGLAREVNAQGQTQTGAVVGTVAYMPPEQARGDIRAMDRRSDVYSLGATLYDMIAGRPPFVAEHPWKLLVMVGYEDAPTLRKMHKGVPPDLETIVMKCLERDPARRYDSARALADDLQRYLDGEPILAKRASLGYVLWKKTKKNKWLTALLIVTTLGSLSFTGAWIHTQRQSALREKLAQELGESVKEMELFLRAAYELPLHDVERERDVVRQRLRKIEARMGSVGKVGEGPGHYAIGRGHLALGETDLAREHLEMAIAAGYSSPDLEYALGRALGELFRRAVNETRRITNAEERKSKVAELEKGLRDPALAHLRAASGALLESPLYAEGLVALYEGKNEEAIAKARAAFEEVPWMYETKELEGDALFAEGSKYRHDAAFDYDKMKKYFDPAAEAYKLAREMAGSDPDVHRAECELWEKMANATSSMGKSPEKDFDVAQAACARAVRASSHDGAARIQRALTLQYRFFWANSVGEHAKEAQAAALEAVDEAVKVRPRDAMALYARASTMYVRVMGQAGRGEKLSIEPAVDAFHRVLEVDPRFTWALSELGQTYLTQAQFERLHGNDPRAALKLARTQFERAHAVDATFSTPALLAVRALCIQLEYETGHGIDAGATIDALTKAVTTTNELKLGGWIPIFWKARFLRLRAADESFRGEDPRPYINEGIAEIHSFVKEGEESAFMLREWVELRLLEAEYALRHKEIPAVDLTKERERMHKEVKELTADAIDEPVLLGRIEWLMLRARDNDTDVHANDFDRVFAEVESHLASERDDPRGYETLAELRAEKALWLESQHKSPDEEIKKAFGWVMKVLAIDPHHANMLVLQGQLLEMTARLAHGEERTAAIAKAKEAFAMAFRENPHLEVRYAVEVQGLASL